MAQVQIYLVGGSNLFRHGLRSYLDCDTFRIAGELDNYTEITAAVGDGDAPDLVLYAKMGVQDDPAEAVRGIHQELPDTHVLVMAEKLVPAEFSACLGANVSGYLLSDISKNALLRSLFRWRTYISAPIDSSSAPR